MERDAVLFAGGNYRLFDAIRPDGFRAPDYRIPSLVVCGGNTVAVTDSAATGADWGQIALGVKVSPDSGASWSDEIRVFTPPCFRATTDFNGTTSAFAMDPVTVERDGKIIMLFDFFPESKGLHDRSRLERTDGYCEIDGKRCLMLFSSKQSFKSLRRGRTATGYACYTLREDGAVYDPDGVKTKYYVPKKHSAACAFETLGDMYYGDGEFLEKEPPLYPENTHDRYVGNIYLNSDMPPLKETPDIVKKIPYRDAFLAAQTHAAPFRAAVACYVFQTESRDGGYTWSQPVDITPQIRCASDGKFFGTGPGSGIVLRRQPENRRNGRILMPFYALGKTAVVYSDDGKRWARAPSRYAKNIDEAQLVETGDGAILCLGRQKKYGKTPLSVSFDGGETFVRRPPCELYSVRCQKSMLLLPPNTGKKFFEGLPTDPTADHLIGVHPTGHDGADSTRTRGVLSVYERKGLHLHKLAELPLKDESAYAYMGEYADFFAYSSVALLPDGAIGVLYEAYPSGCIVFKKLLNAKPTE